jgi:hypothetical protein
MFIIVIAATKGPGAGFRRYLLVHFLSDLLFVLRRYYLT